MEVPDNWHKLLAERGKSIPPTRLLIYRDFFNPSNICSILWAVATAEASLWATIKLRSYGNMARVMAPVEYEYMIGILPLHTLQVEQVAVAID